MVSSAMVGLHEIDPLRSFCFRQGVPGLTFLASAVIGKHGIVNILVRNCMVIAEGPECTDRLGDQGGPAS